MTQPELNRAAIRRIRRLSERKRTSLQALLTTIRDTGLGIDNEETELLLVLLAGMVAGRRESSKGPLTDDWRTAATLGFVAGRNAVDLSEG